MSRQACMLLGLALLAGATTAHSREDSFPRAKKEAMAIQIGKFPPFGGLDTMAALSGQYSIHTFYVGWTGDGAARHRYWLIRRAGGGMRGDPTVRWADSRTCDAVKPFLESLEAVVPPKYDVPGVGAPSPSPGLDGEGYSLWGRAAYADGVPGELTITGDLHGPSAKAWREALAKLQPCWREGPPAD